MASEANTSRVQPARAHAHAEVLGGVVGREREDLEPVVDARVQRAVVPECEALAELGQADEDEREQRAAVPRVVEQNMQVIERVPKRAYVGLPR